MSRLSFLVLRGLPMHTERFRELRKNELSGLLEKKLIATTWRKIVKDQLRSLDIKDLYDHYDFNYNIDNRAATLKNELLEGSYTVSSPLIYRVEKKYGVCRHLVVPQPIDALLMQLLVESVAEKILAKQPSKNAFYSRDKHNVKKPHEVIEYGLSFRMQWKKLQKKIYNFNKNKNLIVVTDLSNYYDSIDLDELRKVFVSQVEANEVVVDLLFKVIQGIAWTPDYLPYSRRGLPISNIEGIRLLAHSFLFEIDAVLKAKSSESFARWMDDITVGVDSKKEGISILSAVSDMLKSRGLALNLAKTAIYDSTSAKHHFQINQNLYLDGMEGIKPGTKAARKAALSLNKKFKSHFIDQSAKHWDKVAKRYITAFGKLSSKIILADLCGYYINYPVLRPNLLIYLSVIGYTKKSGEVLSQVLDNLDLFDDISLFQISYLLTQWKVPRTKATAAWLHGIDAQIAKLGFELKEPLGFHAILWFKTKYSSEDDLLNFLSKFRNLWQSNSYLRRQATISLSRLAYIPDGKAFKMLTEQALSGVQGTVSVATQISSFAIGNKMEPKVKMYLFPTHKQKVYPLGKFMVLCSLLNSEDVRSDQAVIDLVSEYVEDPTYRKILKKSYGLN